MKLGLVVLALACCWMAPAAAQESRTRGTVELGSQWFKRRADTALNPNGAVLDAGSHATTLSARLQAQRSTEKLRAAIDAWGEVGRYDGNPGSRIHLNEALLELTLGESTSLATGVSIARWGTGYAWNPANPVLDPGANNTSRARSYRRDGDPFVRLETSFGRDSAGLYLTHFRQHDPLLSALKDREWMLYGRYQHVLDGGDVTGFAGIGEDEQFAGAAVSATAGDQLELHGELGLRSRRRAPRIDAVAIPTPAGTQTLYTWNFAGRESVTPALLLGGQYTFENRANLIVEYLYNGNGFSGAEFDRLLDAAAGSSGLLGTPFDAPGRGFLLDGNRLVGFMRRHYLFVRIARDQIARDLDFHYYVRAGLEDRSQVHGALLRHALRQGLRAQVSAEWYTGPKRSETRLIPVRRRIEATLSFDF